MADSTVINRTVKIPPGIEFADLLGVGLSSIVYRLDAVLKTPKDDDDLKLAVEREKLAYLRLGKQHPGILRFFGTYENSLILQHASNGTVRQFLYKKSQTPLQQRLRWIEQASDAVAFIHSKGVIHGDISCNNILLDEGLNALLGDFAGSPIDGSKPLVGYEASHEMPNSGLQPSTMSDIFALGSTIYEAMTGSKPYKDMDNYGIEEAFARGDFPSLRDLLACAYIVEKCWKLSYRDTNELLSDVKEEGRGPSFS